jgi:hypothetical protein
MRYNTEGYEHTVDVHMHCYISFLKMCTVRPVDLKLGIIFGILGFFMYTVYLFCTFKCFHGGELQHVHVQPAYRQHVLSITKSPLLITDT